MLAGGVCQMAGLSAAMRAAWIAFVHHGSPDMIVAVMAALRCNEPSDDAVWCTHRHRLQSVVVCCNKVER